MHSAINIANYLLHLSEDPVAKDMRPMKILKLVYISHGWTLGLINKPLISEDVEAWQYGPVIPELYRETKDYRNTPVRSLPQAGHIQLNDAEKSIVEQVFQKYGAFSGLKLSAMTHKVGTPWYEVWTKYKGGTIPRELIQSYYQGLAENA